MCAAPGLLLGWQPGRRLAPSIQGRRREPVAPRAGARGAHPRRDGEPIRGRASRLPFAVVRGYAGSDHIHHGAPNVSTVTCPFTGEVLTAVAALRPDVAIAHTQRADRQGNVQLWGIAGIQREALLAAERTLVTVEEIVDTLEPRPGASIIPGWVLSYVREVPGEPFRRTRWATTPETTTTTSSGTRSHDTETRSCSGSTPTCSTCKGPPDECLSPVPAARGS
jgi:hypothetical protein